MQLYELPADIKDARQKDIEKIFRRIREVNPSNEILTARQRELLKRCFNSILKRPPPHVNTSPIKTGLAINRGFTVWPTLPDDSPVRTLVEQLLKNLESQPLNHAVQEYLSSAYSLYQTDPQVESQLILVQQIFSFYGWSNKGFSHLDRAEPLMVDLRVLLIGCL
jgi:hypothetical protein